MFNAPLERIRFSFTTIFPPIFIPDALLMVRFLRVISGKSADTPEPPKTISEPLPPTKVPLVLLISLFIVSMFEPIFNAPFVRFIVLFIVLLACKLTPFALFIISLLIEAGNSVLADVCEEAPLYSRVPSVP